MVRQLRIATFDGQTGEEVFMRCLSLQNLEKLVVRETHRYTPSIALRRRYGEVHPAVRLTELRYDGGQCSHLARLLSHLPNLVTLKASDLYCTVGQGQGTMVDLILRAPGYDDPPISPPQCKLLSFSGSNLCRQPKHLAWMLDASFQSLKRITMDGVDLTLAESRGVLDKTVS